MKLYSVASKKHSSAGLVGNDFLSLLEMAKRNVLQPGAAVVPCGASLYVMGIHVAPCHVGKYDLSSLNKYRSDTAPSPFTSLPLLKSSLHHPLDNTPVPHNTYP